MDGNLGTISRKSGNLFAFFTLLKNEDPVPPYSYSSAESVRNRGPPFRLGLSPIPPRSRLMGDPDFRFRAR